MMGLTRPQMRPFSRRYPESRSRTSSCRQPSRKPPRPQLRTPNCAIRQSGRLRMDGVTDMALARSAAAYQRARPRRRGACTGARRRVDDRRHRARRPQVCLIRPPGGRLGVADRIRWLGYRPAMRVAAFAAADVLAHPARVDVTGAVILEALINGLPVVATDAAVSRRMSSAAAGGKSSGAVRCDGLAGCLAEVCGPQNATLSAAASLMAILPNSIPA